MHSTQYFADCHVAIISICNLKDNGEHFFPFAPENIHSTKWSSDLIGRMDMSQNVV